jgi:hypothetical protein
MRAGGGVCDFQSRYPEGRRIKYQELNSQIVHRYPKLQPNSRPIFLAISDFLVEGRSDHCGAITGFFLILGFLCFGGTTTCGGGGATFIAIPEHVVDEKHENEKPSL